LPPPPRLGSREGWFDALRPFAYLNHAAVAPHAGPVRAAVLACMDAYAAEGIGGFGATLARRQALRARLAALLGADGDELAFVPNTTAGVITVAQSIAWKPGDRVVLFRGEFPANTTPWQLVAKQHGLELVWLDLADFDASDDQGLAALDAALARGRAPRGRERGAVPQRAAHAARGHGAALQARGAELFVDAIQGLGASPLHVDMGFDYLASGGHKWLLGAEGAGLLYVRRERMAGAHAAPRGLARARARGGLPAARPRAPELRRAAAHRRRGVRAGHPERAGLRGAGRGHRAGRAAGRRAIHAHVNAYLDALEPGLVALGFGSLRASEPERRSTLLSRAPARGRGPRAAPGGPRARGVICAIPDGVLRFSPHFHNHVDEVPGVLDAVREALLKLR
jgi:cysteine desulfurase/selenocysteine lyase